MSLAPLAPPDAPLQDLRVVVRVESDVPQAVAAAHRFCLGLGLSNLLAAHVATAASELANNLWMHARGGGELHLLHLRAAAREGVELRSDDHGPGIADLALAMTEGWSSAGGMGCGLPGVQRLMDEFSLTSTLGQGTVVVARKWVQRPHSEQGTQGTRSATGAQDARGATGGTA